MRRTLGYLSVCFILLTSCREKLSLKGVERLLFKFDDGVTFSTNDKDIIKEFQRVFDGASEKRVCSSDGHVMCLNKEGKILDRFNFVRKDGCLFLIWKNRNNETQHYRLTYNVGMYLGEMHYQLKSKSGGNNQDK